MNVNVHLLGNMVSEVLDDFSQPTSVWQLIILVFCLALGWGLSKALIHVLARRKNEGSLAGRYAGNSLRRAFFPLISWLLVLLAKWLLDGYLSTKVLSLALVPLLGLSVLYITLFMARRVFGISSKAVAAVKLVEKILVALVWLGMLLYVLGVYNDFLSWLDTIAFVINKKTKISLLTLLSAGVWIFLTVVIALLVSSILSDRLERVKSLEPNLKEVLARLIRVLLLIVALLVSLNLVGIDLTALSVFGGALGVALGFGLQKIASNYVSGFIILLDHSLRLGDLITVDKYYGVVTQIRTRYTVLRAPDDTEVLVPNESMIASVVQNYSYSEKTLRLSVRVQASYQSSPEDVLKILGSVTTNVPRVLKNPPAAAYLVDFAENGINYEIGFWVGDPAEGRLNVQSEVNLAIWRAFRQHGIEIPYPQRTLHVVKDAIT